MSVRLITKIIERYKNNFKSIHNPSRDYENVGLDRFTPKRLEELMNISNSA